MTRGTGPSGIGTLEKGAGKPDWKDAEIGAELRYRCEHKGRHCVIRKYGDLGVTSPRGVA